MAYFVISFGISPREYFELTLGQRNALIKAHERLNRGR
jgi:hypothetical protein